MTRRPCATCGRNRDERFFVSARGRICADCQRRTTRTRQRRGHVARTFSLAPESYAALLAHQRGACSICGGVRRYALDVDHDHATGKVRGLLCKTCNRRLLPAAKDDPEILRAAIRYLEWPPVASLAMAEGVTA